MGDSRAPVHHTTSRHFGTTISRHDDRRRVFSVSYITLIKERVKSSTKRHFPKVPGKITNQNLRYNQINFLFTYIPYGWHRLFVSFPLFSTLTIRTFTPKTLVSLQITSNLVRLWRTASPISFYSYFTIIFSTVSLLFVSSRHV